MNCLRTYSAAFRQTGGGRAAFLAVGLFYSAFSAAMTPPVAVNGNFTFAAKTDGTLLAWGSNNFGQLGDGTTIARTMPATVTGIDATAIASIQAGSNFTIMLKSDGTVWSWGNNSAGALGDGTTTNRYAPARVSVLSGVTAIAAGSSSAYALAADGTVWAWGDNYFGQIGNGSTATRTIPAPLPVSGLSGVTAIAAGGSHVLAQTADGSIWAWGYNALGQLGDGTTTNRAVPVRVSGLANATALLGGSFHSVALKSDGTVWTWGGNIFGELGDATNTNRSTPAAISTLGNVSAIASGSASVYALKSDGTVWSWGNNEVGQLGDGTATHRSLPAQLPGLSGVSSIAAGNTSMHAVAVRGNGTLSAWGENDAGQLGNGSSSGPESCVVDARLGLAYPCSKSAIEIPNLNLMTGSDDCLFNWAEKNYPALLAPSGASTQTATPYRYRYYAQTASYLAVNTSDAHTYFQGLIDGVPNLVDLGATSTWLATAGCR